MLRNRIAVMMSTYNGGEYIKEQLESILNQKLKNSEIEIFIRDDGSTDNTVFLLQDYFNRDKRIHLIKGNNIGYVASFFALANFLKNNKDMFQYYAFSDQDDFWDKDKLQIAIDRIEEIKMNKPILYSSVSRIVDEKLQFIRISKYPRRKVCFYNTAIQTYAAGHTYVFNRALLEKMSPSLNPKMIYGHDSYFANIAAITGVILFDPVPHASYRQHNKNQLGTSSNNILQWSKSRFARVLKGDSKKYAKQIYHIYKIHGEELGKEERQEMKEFFEMQKSFYTRIVYSTIRTRLYRQGIIENIAFKILYILGGYKI